MLIHTTSAAPSTITYSVAIGVGVSLVFWYYRQWKNRTSMPKKWRRIGTLDQINIFPIKSCAPLNLKADTEVDCDILGLKLNDCRDRALMMINNSNEMITARVYPHMVLIATELVGSHRLQFSAPGMKSIELELSTLKSEGEQIETKVWSTSVNVYLVGTEYDRWFSIYILRKQSGIRLVHYPFEKPVKAINSRMARQPFILKEDRGTFNDATSYMLINLSSIEELSTRLPRSLDPLQFRGNFHLKMDIREPYAEDYWNWVKIGDDVIFRVVAPCTRCILPNIDVKTAKRDPNGEPFNTLKKFRLFKGYASPALGIHLGLRVAGTIKKGAVIYVEDN